jgi:hypothetical protein
MGLGKTVQALAKIEMLLRRLETADRRHALSWGPSVASNPQLTPLLGCNDFGEYVPHGAHFGEILNCLLCVSSF